MLKAYFDNNVASAISRSDWGNAEQDAIKKLLEANRSGRLELGTSRHTQREMERAPPQHHHKLKMGLSELDIAKFDHKVLGFCTQTDPYGGIISSPLVTDIVDDKLFSALLAAGLEADDAKHLMYAVQNGYERFVTGDGDFLNRRVVLEKHCPSIQIQKPSELAAELM